MVLADGIQSANVVGYDNNTTSGANFNFLAIPFNAVGFNTADIQQIVIDDDGAESIGWGTEFFSVWAGLPEVVDGSEFVYQDPSNDPEEKATTYYWGNELCEKVSFPIAPGQGVVIDMAEGLAVSIEPPYSL